jgi:hypothetical protein
MNLMILGFLQLTVQRGAVRSLGNFLYALHQYAKPMGNIGTVQVQERGNSA